MSAQGILGAILILVGAIIALVGFFVITPQQDFIVATIVTVLGFVLIVVGGGILKTRAGMWARKP